MPDAAFLNKLRAIHRLTLQLFFEHLVDNFWVCLAPGLLHDPPHKNPNSLDFPCLYALTSLGQRSNTLETTASITEKSATCTKPFSSTISPGDFPDRAISSKQSWLFYR